MKKAGMTKRELQGEKEYIRRDEEIRVSKRLWVSWGSCKKHSATQNVHGKIRHNGEIRVTLNIRVMRSSNSTYLQHTATAFMTLY